MREIDTAPDISQSVGISAILRGFKGRTEKGYYIQTSGAALIWDKPDGSKSGEKVWDDVKDVDTITSMEEDVRHRSEDKVFKPLSLKLVPKANTKSS